MRTPDQIQADYMKYRGTCKEACEALVSERPELRIVRGHYFCASWCSNEPHWWCVDPHGNIVDPTKLQFPCAGLGTYTEFDGWCECAQCGKEFLEEHGRFASNYAFCSAKCNMRFVGL